MYVYTYTHIHIFILRKTYFVGNFPFSLTCLSCKCPFSLCKSACVLQWVTGILTDSGLKHSGDFHFTSWKARRLAVPALVWKLTNVIQDPGTFHPVFPLGPQAQGHKTVSTEAGIAAPPSLSWEGVGVERGNGHFFSSDSSLLSEGKVFPRSPRRHPVVLARTGQLATLPARKRVSLCYEDHNAHNWRVLSRGTLLLWRYWKYRRGTFGHHSKKKRGAAGMSWISLRMLNVLKCTEPFYTSNKICLTQNTNSSAIKKHWARTNDHSPHGLKVSRLEHSLGAESKKENTAPRRGALVPSWGSGGGCLIMLACWILFRKYCYLQRTESKAGKSTPRAAFIFPNEEISL